jgi:hypothetical protein
MHFACYADQAVQLSTLISARFITTKRTNKVSKNPTNRYIAAHSVLHLYYKHSAIFSNSSIPGPANA